MTVLKDPITSSDHIQGLETASITLLEYGDYECPYCGMAYSEIKKVQSHFGDQLRFIFRNFPLTEVHPHAEIAAEAAEFAGDRGLFWEMHDLIYENQQNLSLSLLLQLGDSLNLSVEDLKLAIQNKIYAPKIRTDFLGGVRSGVNGTPTFYINDLRYGGPFDYKSMKEAIESKLIHKD